VKPDERLEQMGGMLPINGCSEMNIMPGV